MDLPFGWPPELHEEHIGAVTALDPGYEDHGSDVWLVEGGRDEFILRSFRHKEIPNNPFWQGCYRLFNLDPRLVENMEQVNERLQTCDFVRAPVVHKRYCHQGREFLRVARMPGRLLEDFAVCSLEALYGFGQWLAGVHDQDFSFYGCLGHKAQRPLAQFHRHTAAVIEQLVTAFYSNQSDIVQALPAMKRRFARLPPPDRTSLIMVDMDPTQFLVEAGRITAVVDTEAYVVGPAALDFIALEYVIKQREAQAITDGYVSRRALPELAELREPYRYLYRIFEIQGDVPLLEWMGQPILF